MIFGEKTEEQKRVAELTREVKELRKELLASKLDKKQVEVQMKELKDALELGGNLRQGYVLSTLVFALYCVWQFVYSYGTVDFRYLLLFLQYVPMSLALTWCYDNGGSIWSPIALHMVLNALILASAVLGA